MVKIKFLKKSGETFEVNADVGMTLLEVAKQNNVDLFGACDGSCACGTCHVYIDDETLKKIEPATEDEENVLDIVLNVNTNSRLACQVVVSEKMDGATITIPE